MSAIKASGEYGNYWYWESSNSRNVLTLEQMQTNALYFYGKCENEYGWSLNAISAMLGNIRHEGIMNPAQWQYGFTVGNPKAGYGLCQWTPSTNLTDWAESTGRNRLSMDCAIERIKFELDSGIQYYPTSKYPLSFAQFVISDEPPSYLALCWLYNYERPKNPEATEQIRKDSADYWYEYLTGEEPPDPPDPPTPITQKTMPIWMYPSFRKN